MFLPVYYLNRYISQWHILPKSQVNHFQKHDGKFNMACVHRQPASTSSTLRAHVKILQRWDDARQTTFLCSLEGTPVDLAVQIMAWPIVQAHPSITPREGDACYSSLLHNTRPRLTPLSKPTSGLVLIQSLLEAPPKQEDACFYAFLHNSGARPSWPGIRNNDLTQSDSILQDPT
jgi:hypothetical protein